MSAMLRNRLGRLGDDLRLAVFHCLANVIGGSSLVPRDLRLLIYMALGMKVRTGAVWPHVIFKSRRVHFGRHVMINQGCRFDNVAEVVLGDNVHVGPEVLFDTTTHELGGSQQRASAQWRAEPIHVGAGAWIGARAVILPGVTVGAGAVIAAGAVVAADCAPDGLYGGVPARLIRKLDESVVPDGVAQA